MIVARAWPARKSWKGLRQRRFARLRDRGRESRRTRTGRRTGRTVAGGARAHSMAMPLTAWRPAECRRGGLRLFHPARAVRHAPAPGRHPRVPDSEGGTGAARREIALSRRSSRPSAANGRHPRRTGRDRSAAVRRRAAGPGNSASSHGCRTGPTNTIDDCRAWSGHRRSTDTRRNRRSSSVPSLSLSESRKSSTSTLPKSARCAPSAWPADRAGRSREIVTARGNRPGDDPERDLRQRPARPASRTATFAARRAAQGPSDARRARPLRRVRESRAPEAISEAPPASPAHRQARARRRARHIAAGRSSSRNRTAARCRPERGIFLKVSSTPA